MTDSRIGIESIGVYIPSARHTAEYISSQSGTPVDILVSKMGLTSKAIPEPDDHTVAMGVKAAQVAIDRANIDPATDIDLVIWAGEVHCEHPMQTYAIKFQNEVGASKAWAFDINQRCGTFIVGMLLAKSLMATHGYKRVLISSGYRNCDLIDYTNIRTRFMHDLAASGVAMILQAEYDRNLVLEGSVISDGSFSEDVYVPAGGTVMPVTCEAIEKRLNYLDVINPDGLKDRLDRLSMLNFLRVVDESLEKSGYSRSDIDYLGLIKMKRSAFEYVAKELGLDPYMQSTYFEEWGHMGQNDAVVSLEEGLKSGKINDGDIVVLTAAGIGWAWNALTIKWGPIGGTGDIP
ncbi:MAG: 3-oxoacyl-ACP synthase [Candidatus Thorarchaeota archaeon]|nr:3-oxoacyl-ACP synthase [Candidatus Thorarchaeota archaeon]